MSSNKKSSTSEANNVYTNKLLLVESPSKAKTIEKYLNGEFKVLATFGHVRDIQSKAGSVLPEKDFFMNYEVNLNSKRHLDLISEFIINALKNQNTVELFIATDPDREGEAIAWHVLEALKANKKINFNKIVIFRSVFNEITKNAVLNAIKNPRQIDLNLVDSQQARRALDYLVGFTLSPILWKTVGGSGSSAGRVQSVGLRLLCEREKEIFKFCPQEFWTIHGDFFNKEKNSIKLFDSELIQFNNKKLEKFSIPNKDEAKRISELILSEKIFKIKEIQIKDQQRSPQAPFSTSTLQQEASTKLGFSAKKTMSVAQKLYEGIKIKNETVGLITYMRTDGIFVSDAAIKDTKDEIKKRFGSEFLPNSSREFKNKNKSAQEAHEAIRPTNMGLFPDESLKSFLTEDEFKLYNLIYKRMMASQMSNVIFGICNIFLSNQNEENIFKTSFSSVKFPGYTKIYNEENDKNEDGNKNFSFEISSVKEGDIFEISKIEQKQHFTTHPPRFGEASLIKKMEEIGIGRPSTYASIISVLQDREYAILEKKKFFVTIKGHIISDFLVNFFEKYVAYDFTANMENDLDRIASGEIFWKEVMKNFWDNFNSKAKEVSSIKTTEIIDKVSSDMKSYIFQNKNQECEGDDSDFDDQCPKCFENLGGKLKLKFSKYGYFLGCDKYPECDFIRSMPNLFLQNMEGSEIKETSSEDLQKFNKDNIDQKPLIDDEDVMVLMKTGKFGKYLEVFDKKTNEKKNVGFPENFAKIWSGSFESLIKNLSKLPMSLGKNPETSEDVKLNLGKFGFYVSSNKQVSSIKSLDPFSISLNSALSALKENLEKQKKNSKEIELEQELGGSIKLQKGGFGKLYLIFEKNKFFFDEKNNTFVTPKKNQEGMIEITIPENKLKTLMPKGIIEFSNVNSQILKEFLKSLILKFKPKKRVVRKKKKEEI